MTTKQLRARLRQLERATKSREERAEETKRPFEFPIDPELAKSLWNDKKQFDELESARGSEQYKHGRVDTPEQAVIRARMSENASKVVCPPCYGLNEYWEDHGPVVDIWTERRKLSEAEDVQRIARMEVFLNSPEGRGRVRLRNLLFGVRCKSPAEHDEIDRLIKLYPEAWAHPEDKVIIAYEMSARGTPEKRKRDAEIDQRWTKMLAVRRSEPAQNKK